MKIKPWISPEDQCCTLGRHTWSVPRLFELTRNLPVMELPINAVCVAYSYEKLMLREMVMHMKAVVNDADLSLPIILDEDGEVMDGRHRLMKAMLTGAETIKAVRFEENPTPDRVAD
ncbi:MAG: chromosome partitioning protein ParB [Rubrivivax sp.]|nr:MAG: chromosome partitioning protein ParB [Rubrivivax sp.]